MICDLAETYHIYDWRRVPVSLLGILVAGLSYNSRVALAERGEDFPLETMFLASANDSINAILYGLFMKKHDRPISFVDKLLKEQKRDKDIKIFRSGEDFMKARAKIIKDNKDG